MEPKEIEFPSWDEYEYKIFSSDILKNEFFNITKFLDLDENLEENEEIISNSKLSKLLGGIVEVQHNPNNIHGWNMCSLCAYCKLCQLDNSLSRIIVEDLGELAGVCTSHRHLKLITSLYPTEELHECLGEIIRNEGFTEDEKYNTMKLLIMAEYEKYKREN